MKKKIIVFVFLIFSGFVFLSGPALAGDRFVVSKNQIKDTQTGLIWYKGAISVSTIMKALNPDAKKGDKLNFNGLTVQLYIDKMNSAQKTDWRLPSIDELKSFVPFLEANSLEKKQLFYLAKAEKETALMIYIHLAHTYMKDFFQEPGIKNAQAGRIYALVLVKGKNKAARP